jgi:hypothetical protein
MENKTQVDMSMFPKRPEVHLKSVTVTSIGMAKRSTMIAVPAFWLENCGVKNGDTLKISQDDLGRLIITPEKAS